MPTASYQQNNDYSLVDRLRPFNMPYESTMQEIATKTQYWKAGADRMKSIYDQAVGLDPQFTQNKEYLKGFMSDAQKNMQKLNNADLGVLENSQEVMNVFKPLYDTTNPFNLRLLEDSQLNKHYQKQQQISDMYRTKDGGKEWNQNNDIYFKDAQQKYLQDAQNGNIDSIDSHFQNKKSFIPYYDGKKEILDIQDACKGASYHNKRVSESNPLYTQDISKTGCTPAELALALETGLSDRYKQQAYIDGYVHFKGNEDVLAKKFTDVYITQKKEQIDEINAKINGMEDGGVSKNEKTRYDYYKSLVSQLQPKLDDSIKEYNKLTQGNPLEYIKKNYERLAGQVYFGELASNLATAYRTDEEKNLIGFNQVALTQLKMEFDRTNMVLERKWDREDDYQNYLYRKEENKDKYEYDLNLAKLKGELKGGSSLTGIPLMFDPVTQKNVDINPTTKDDFIDQQLKPAAAKATTTYNVVEDLIRKELGKNDVRLTHNEILGYITEIEDKKNRGEIISPKANNILEAFNRYKVAKDDLSFVNDQIAAAEAIIKKDHKELFNDSQYSNEKLSNYSFKVGDQILKPIPISEKDMFQILQGKNVNGFTVGKKVVAPAYNPYDRVQGSGNSYIIKTLLYNGKLVDLKNTKIGDLFNSAVDKSVDQVKQIEKYETQFFTEESYINSKLTVFNKMDFGKSSEFENEYGEKIKAMFTISAGLNDKNGYAIVGRDKYGSGVYVRELDKDGKPKSLDSDTFAKLRASEKGAFIKEDKNTQSYYIPDFLPRYVGLPDNKTLDKYNKIESHMRNILSSLENDPKFTKPATVDTKEFGVGGTTRFINNNGREFLISIFKQEGEPIEYVARYINNTTKQESEFKSTSVSELLAQIDPQIR